MHVDVLIPVLGRPQRIAPLMESLVAALDGTIVRELFLCTHGDDAEIAQLERLGYRYTVLAGPRMPGDYNRKINHGCRMTEGEWIFLGADDLHFHHGWTKACLARHAESGALVIGTNDLGNPMVKSGRHATHSLVHRDYLQLGTIDEPGKLLCELYDHNATDVEFTETAIHRSMWAFAADAHVEHLHPAWHKGVQDSTYTLGQANHMNDIRLLRDRGHLWHHRAVMMQMQQARRQAFISSGRSNRQIRLR